MFNPCTVLAVGGALGVVQAGSDGTVMGLLEEGFEPSCCCGVVRIQWECCSLLEGRAMAAACCKGRDSSKWFRRGDSFMFLYHLSAYKSNQETGNQLLGLSLPRAWF